MSGFSSLPNELIIQVWRQLLNPESVENFALTCKSIHALGSSFIKEHNTLKAKFSSIFHGEDNVSSGPAETLLTLIKNPHAALYIRNLTINGRRSTWEDSNDSGRAGHGPYPGDTMELFRHAIKDSRINSEIDIAPWLNALETGNGGVVLSMMLTMLPNVRSLNLHRLCSTETLVSDTIKRIAESRDTEALSQLAEVRLLARHGFRAIEAWNIHGECCYLNPLHFNDSCFSECYDTDSNYDFFHKLCYEGRLSLFPETSTVTRLTFVNCFFIIDRLENFLRGLRALESFEYLTEFYLEQPQEIVSILRTHAKNTLRKLRLRSDSKARAHALSLVDFQVMSEIEFGDVLIEDWLANVLPPSIEKSHLRRYWYYTHDVVEHDVARVIVDKAARLPNLKELTLQLYWIDDLLDTETISMMKQECEDVGIKLSIVGDQKTVSYEGGQCVVVRK